MLLETNTMLYMHEAIKKSHFLGAMPLQSSLFTNRRLFYDRSKKYWYISLINKLLAVSLLLFQSGMVVLSLLLWLDGKLPVTMIILLVFIALIQSTSICIDICFWVHGSNCGTAINYAIQITEIVDSK